MFLKDSKIIQHDPCLPVLVCSQTFIGKFDIHTYAFKHINKYSNHVMYSFISFFNQQMLLWDFAYRKLSGTLTGFNNAITGCCLFPDR